MITASLRTSWIRILLLPLATSVLNPGAAHRSSDLRIFTATWFSALQTQSIRVPRLSPGISTSQLDEPDCCAQFQQYAYTLTVRGRWRVAGHSSPGSAHWFNCAPSSHLVACYRAFHTRHAGLTGPQQFPTAATVGLYRVQFRLVVLTAGAFIVAQESRRTPFQLIWHLAGPRTPSQTGTMRYYYYQ